MKVIRGCMFGVIFSIPLWLLIFLLVKLIGG